MKSDSASSSGVSKFRFQSQVFKYTLTASGIFMLILLSAMFITLLISSIPSIREFGIGFLFGSEWDPVKHEYNAAPFLVGTLLTSMIAIVITIPFSIAIALLLGEYYKSGLFPSILRSMIELLAGIPSVIFGFWALSSLVPVISQFQNQINVVPYGVGIFTASIILSIMIIPYSASVAREVISMVPGSLKDAAYSLGSTRLEVIFKIVLPYSSSGIFAGILLAFGRAIGETMAVTMVIGNKNGFPDNIFSPGNTMASIIANEFTEATGKIYLSSLLEIALILFVVTTIINFSGRLIIDKLSKGKKK